MKNRIIAISLMLLSLCATTALWANNEKPFVIPELRHWQGGEGVVNISDATKVIYTNAELANVAEALAKDYGLLFGKAMKAKITKSAIMSATGAILINLISDKELGDEGITSWDSVSVSSPFGDCKVLTMKASGFEGEFYLYKVQGLHG